jgi:hypothetical protein
MRKLLFLPEERLKFQLDSVGCALPTLMEESPLVLVWPGKIQSVWVQELLTKTIEVKSV